MSQEFVSTKLTEGVLRLTLEGGTAHVLSRAMIGALDAALAKAAVDDAVRVIVLHGPGRIFCAGHDLKEIAAHRQAADSGLAYLTDLFDACGAMMQQLAQIAKPTIAVVEGVATAGGLQLAASCDLVFAAQSARFSLPGVNNGGFCTTPAVAVGRRIGRGALMQLALSGEMMASDWALRVGLIDQLWPDDEVVGAAMTFATKLATRHAPAISAGKVALEQQLALPLEAAYTLATEVMIGHFMDPVRIAIERAKWAK